MAEIVQYCISVYHLLRLCEHLVVCLRSGFEDESVVRWTIGDEHLERILNNINIYIGSIQGKI